MSAFAGKSIGIIFGTDTGNTEEIAERLTTRLEGMGATVTSTNITEATADDFAGSDLLILGIPTWDFGGIQADWEDSEGVFAQLEMQGQTVALYGLGDQFGYGDYFVDAMGWLHEQLEPRGAQFIGFWSTQGYEFEASRAVADGADQFCGLAIDEDQQFELTDARLDTWVAQLGQEVEQRSAA